jgi:hypothetical protein
MYVREMQHFLHAVASEEGTINNVDRAAETTAVALDVLENGGPAMQPHSASGRR